MIAGLEEISGGSVTIGGEEVNDVPAADRGIAMVFQSYALYPHMSVRENIGFGLKMAGVAADQVKRKVAEAAATLHIEELLDRRPRELSGGQRQRVAIGRAIVKEPKVFLFDEPLSNLDADLRAQMRVEIARLHKSLDSTVIYVTHDQVEAMTLANRIVVMRDGVVEQVGAPTELYERPANVFVARFLGQPKMNLLPATFGGASPTPQIRLASGATLSLPELSASVSPGSPVTLGIRPDDIAVVDDPASRSLEGRVEITEQLGNEVLVHVRLPDVAEAIVVVQPKRSAFTAGQEIGLRIEPADMHLFGPDGIRI